MQGRSYNMACMILVRVWRRQLLGGMGAAVVVPGAVVVALAVLALAGGFAGLTALGQALSGPPAPASALAGRPVANARPVPAALVAALAAPAAAGVSRSRGQSPATGGAPAAPSPPTSQSGPTSRSQRPGGPTHAPGGGGPAPAPSPSPKPQPTLIDGIVSIGTAVTSRAPAPAGPAATGALQTTGSTLDAIAPIRQP